MQMGAERAAWEALAATGRLVVHATACLGMRECGDADIDQSCHWAKDGKYLCLTCAPLPEHIEGLPKQRKSLPSSMLHLLIVGMTLDLDSGQPSSNYSEARKALPSCQDNRAGLVTFWLHSDFDKDWPSSCVDFFATFK